MAHFINPDALVLAKEIDGPWRRWLGDPRSIGAPKNQGLGPNSTQMTSLIDKDGPTLYRKLSSWGFVKNLSNDDFSAKDIYSNKWLKSSQMVIALEDQPTTTSKPST